MKKLILYFCLILLIVPLPFLVVAFNGKKPSFQELTVAPIWVKDYFKQLSTYTKRNNGKLTEIIGEDNVKLIIQKEKSTYKLDFYRENKFIRRLLTSNLGFDDAIWSKDFKYFFIANIISAHDWKYIIDWYVFSFSKDEFILVYSEKRTSGTAVGFSNNNKFFAFGSGNDLVLYEIETKRKKNIKVPSNYAGSVSVAVWKEDDSEIFIYYVTPAGTKLYLVSNFK